MVAKKKVGYVSAHKSKMEAEKTAKQLMARVIRTPRRLQEKLKGKLYMVVVDL